MLIKYKWVKKLKIKGIFKWLKREERALLSNKVPKISEHVVWRRVKGSKPLVIALNLKSGIFHILEDAEAEVWLLTDGKRTTNQIIEILCKKLPDMRSKKITEIIKKFKNNELINLI